MKNFNFKSVTTAKEASKLISGRATFLAGGMTLIPAIKLRLAAYSDIINIKKIKGLSGIKVSSKSLKIGPGIEKDTDLTPVISENQLQKVEGYARSGIQEGAEAAYGGKRLEREGYFMEPTVLNNVKQNMTVAREEIFGPVLSVLEYEDQEEAINIANDTEYGLGAGVFTKDLKKASWTASKLEAGQVYVNKWFTGNHATPFGGYKQSGYSREKGVDGLKSYLQVKNVGISLS